MQLRPREIFTIVRGLEDHEDTNTYYVRAVVRNARTDEIIDTLDLEDRGDGHRFAIEWRVPADPANYGFYIIITTSVYTDAAYTTKSLYQDRFETYLIAERPNPTLAFGGGGGGDDIDYKKIRKIISEELIKILLTGRKKNSPLPTPQSLGIDLKPLQQEIAAIKEGLSEIKKHPASLAEFVTTIQKKIEGIPQPKEVNFKSLQEWIADNLAKISQELNKQISKNTDLIVQDSQKTQEIEVKGVKRDLLEVKKIVNQILACIEMKSAEEIKPVGNKFGL